MHYLVNRIVATGIDVFHPGQSPATADDDHSNYSDLEAVSGSSSFLNNKVANEIMDDEDQTVYIVSLLLLFSQFN
jgi:hypothetical protein